MYEWRTLGILYTNPKTRSNTKWPLRRKVFTLLIMRLLWNWLVTKRNKSVIQPSKSKFLYIQTYSSPDPSPRYPLDPWNWKLIVQVSQKKKMFKIYNLALNVLWLIIKKRSFHVGMLKSKSGVLRLGCVWNWFQVRSLVGLLLNEWCSCSVLGLLLLLLNEFVWSILMSLLLVPSPLLQSMMIGGPIEALMIVVLN